MILEKTYTRVSEFDHQTLLEMDHDPTLSGEDSASVKKAFSITTYNPSGNPNKFLMKNNWNLLGKSSTTLELFEHKVIHGHCRCPNLRDQLVHAKLKPKLAPQTAISGSITNTCLSKQCRYCPKLNKSGTITSPATGKHFKCCKNFNCSSSNLIYCLHCQHCQLLYVGQTKRPFKKRLVEHFSNINKKDPTKPLGSHFGKTGHPNISVLEIFVLKFIKADPNSVRAQTLRDFHELQWIHCLKTSLPFGLNSMD